MPSDCELLKSSEGSRTPSRTDGGWNCGGPDQHLTPPHSLLIRADILQLTQ
jgi:hypothetical protein